MYNLVKDREHYSCIGKVIKTHAIRGEVVFFLDVNEPEAYRNLDAVFLDMDGSLVPWFVENISISGDQAIVKLQDIDSPEQAQGMLKCDLYLPKEQLADDTDNDHFTHELSGYRVFDLKHGEIGIVDAILERSEQELLRILKDGREILVPYNEDLIEEINIEKKELHLKTPEGLIDLYLG